MESDNVTVVPFHLAQPVKIDPIIGYNVTIEGRLVKFWKDGKLVEADLVELAVERILWLQREEKEIAAREKSDAAFVKWFLRVMYALFVPLSIYEAFRSGLLGQVLGGAYTLIVAGAVVLWFKHRKQ